MNNALSITKYIVEKYKINYSIKIQKILYFLFLDYIKINNLRFFKEDFEAWIYGPVVPKVFYHIKNYGFDFSEIEKYDDKNDEYLIEKIEELKDEKVKKFIDDNIYKYINIDTLKLVNLSHNTKPWINARKGIDSKEICSEIINYEDMKQWSRNNETSIRL